MTAPANAFSRACMHDPETYENPDEFRPERFIRDGRLDNAVRDPFDYVFGFGRRYAITDGGARASQVDCLSH